MLPSSAWQRRHEVFHPYTFILLLTNLSLGFVLPYLWDRRPSSLGQMQLTTPRLVPMAVRMVMSVWITSFQMSRFSIVFWFWFMICASSVTDFHPLATWVGIIFPTDNAKIQFCAPGCQEASPFWRRFNTSRACHFFGRSPQQLVWVQRRIWVRKQKYYISDVYRFFGPLRMTRNGSSCLLAIFVPFNNCKIGICKDNSCFVQQGGGRDGRGGTHKCNYSYYRLQITVR